MRKVLKRISFSVTPSMKSELDALQESEQLKKSGDILRDLIVRGLKASGTEIEDSNIKHNKIS